MSPPITDVHIWKPSTHAPQKRRLTVADHAAALESLKRDPTVMVMDLVETPAASTAHLRVRTGWVEVPKPALPELRKSTAAQRIIAAAKWIRGR